MVVKLGLLMESIERLALYTHWRRMQRISWTERKTYRDVLGLVGKKRSFMDTVRGRRWTITIGMIHLDI